MQFILSSILNIKSCKKEKTQFQRDIHRQETSFKFKVYQAPEEKRKKYYRVAEQREVVGIYKKNTIYIHGINYTLLRE